MRRGISDISDQISGGKRKARRGRRLRLSVVIERWAAGVSPQRSQRAPEETENWVYSGGRSDGRFFVGVDFYGAEDQVF
jgi:hypothetical protein